MYIYIYTHIYIYIYPPTLWVARCVYHDVGCSDHMLVFWGMDCFNSLCVHSPTLLGPMVTHPLDLLGTHPHLWALMVGSRHWENCLGSHYHAVSCLHTVCERRLGRVRRYIGTAELERWASALLRLQLRPRRHVRPSCTTQSLAHTIQTK